MSLQYYILISRGKERSYLSVLQPCTLSSLFMSVVGKANSPTPSRGKSGQGSVCWRAQIIHWRAQRISLFKPYYERLCSPLHIYSSTITVLLGWIRKSTGQGAAAITTCVAAATLTPDRIGRIRTAQEAADGQADEAAATQDEPGGAAAAGGGNYSY
jgi:hypothetical protein